MSYLKTLGTIYLVLGLLLIGLIALGGPPTLAVLKGTSTPLWGYILTIPLTFYIIIRIGFAFSKEPIYSTLYFKDKQIPKNKLYRELWLLLQSTVVITVIVIIIGLQGLFLLSPILLVQATGNNFWLCLYILILPMALASMISSFKFKTESRTYLESIRRNKHKPL